MKKLLLALAFATLSAGCVSLKTGPEPEKYTTPAVTRAPFKTLEVEWTEMPLRMLSEDIGYLESERKEQKPVPVVPEDKAKLKRMAEEIFAERGLYDVATGSGTVRISLTSYSRWTYGLLWKGYFVETGYIFIWPSSIVVNHAMKTEFEKDGLPLLVEKTASVKTIFHALLFPLGPFIPAGGRENAAIKSMLNATAESIRHKW